MKQTDGSFSLDVPLPGETDDITYKYVVDGEWKVNPNEATTKDESGNENNVIVKEDLHELSSMPGAFIPESGLVAATTAPAAAQDGELKTTVMPKEEPHHASVAGEPGVFVPKDQETLSAFEKIEDTDAKALNENVTEIGTANNIDGQSTIPAPTTGVLVEGSELTPEERKKQKKKIKRSQYKAKKKKKAAEAKAANGDAAAGSSEFDSEEMTPEPTTKDIIDGDEDKEKISTTGFAAGAGTAAASAAAAGAALANHSETPGSTTHPVNDNVTKDIEEPVVANVDVDAVDGVKAPIAEDTVVDEVPSTTVVVEAPVVNDSTPVVEDEPVVDSTPAVNGAPVVDSTPAVNDAPIVSESTPVVEETKVETEEVVANNSVPVTETDDIPKTLDPKVALDNEAKEVDASPVHKEPLVVSQDNEDIVIAAPGDTEKDIAAAVEAREGGNVTLEEIEPTESQKERLTKEANLDTATATKKTETPAKKTASTPTKATPTAKSNGKAEEKKKGGFRKMLKKIFS